MKLSEFNEKIKSLFGDEDVDIYLDTTSGIKALDGDFNIFIDGDGDARIEATLAARVED